MKTSKNMSKDIVYANENNNISPTEGYMPDFSKTVKDRNGDTWCYDYETNSVLRVKLEKPVYTTIPQEVLLDLLSIVAKSDKDTH